MLALSFLVLIGASLIAEGFGTEIDKAFIYGPMAFAVIVEALNITAKSRAARRNHSSATPVDLHDAIVSEAKPAARKPRAKK
jgi:predicted tellurium resistance membrane protein TerC